MTLTVTDPPANPPTDGLQTPPQTPPQTATNPPAHTHPHTPKGLSPSLSGARPLQGVKITADLLNIQKARTAAPQVLAQSAWIMPDGNQPRQAWHWVGRGVQRSIRFTDDQARRLEREAADSGVSFPEMVRLCCDFALGYVQGLRGDAVSSGRSDDQH